MPEKEFITLIAGIVITDREEKGLGIILKGFAPRPADLRCRDCQSPRLRTKGTVVRVLKHALWARRLVYLEVKVPKFHCPSCKRYFVLRIPGVLPKKRATEQFRQEVFHLHQGGMPQKHLSVTHQIGTATVERWYQDFVAYRVKELEGRLCPRVLGIDEHFFSRKEGFATTFADLKNHKVFDVVLGRSEESLKAFLKRLKGRERVQIVVMDLSETYRRLIQKYFPQARIVADRFHVTRLLNHHFLKVWGMLDPEGRKSRGLLSLMRRHEANLKPEQVPKLKRYFNQIPGLETLYRFKQDLMQLLLKKHQKRKEAKVLIPQLLWHLQELLKSPWQPMQAFGKTLQSWLEPIVRMWRFTKNNGITEGLHTKMEMISRRAFGFRNFKNYRLRVIALCGWNGVFTIRN